MIRCPYCQGDRIEERAPIQGAFRWWYCEECGEVFTTTEDNERKKGVYGDELTDRILPLPALRV